MLNPGEIQIWRVRLNRGEGLPPTAEEAERWSLLNHRVPATVLESFTLDLAQRIATKAPLAVSAIKEQLRMLGDSAPLQPGIFERIQELRNTWALAFKLE